MWPSVQPRIFKWQDIIWTTAKVSHPPPQCHEYYPTTNICKLHQKPKLSLKYSELVRGLLLLSPNHHLNVKSNFQPEANPPPGHHWGGSTEMFWMTQSPVSKYCLTSFAPPLQLSKYPEGLSTQINPTLPLPSALHSNSGGSEGGS